MNVPMKGPKAPKSVSLWLQLWNELEKPDQRRLKIAVAALLVGSLMTALTPFFVGMFVDAVIQDGQVVGLAQAWRPLLLLATAMTVISTMAVIQHQQVHTVTTAFTAGMRNRIYAALMRWELARYIEGSRGAIYGRANRSIEGAERLMKIGAADLLPAVMVTFFGTILAIVQYGTVGLVMIAVIPTGFALVRWQIRSQNGIRVQVGEAKERIDGDVSAWLTGIEVIRTLGVEKFFTTRIARRTSDLRSQELTHHLAMAKFDALKAVNEALWLIATLAAVIGLQASSSPGYLAGVVLLFLAITKPLRELHRVLDEGAEAALQTQNLQDDLMVPHDPSYSPLRNGESPDVPVSLSAIGSALTFHKVSFAYTEGGQDVLQELTLSIAAGERVGIVGASGCGKSTLLKLASRLTHGFRGEIYINGQPLQEMDRNDLSQAVGYVGQKPLLFQGTIQENLTLGRPDISDEDLVLACKRANIHTDILAMPRGYDTIVGEEGARLSGGQSQRLCLARALVRTPPIMLLDEPTSALDGPSQAVVQQAIDGLDDITMIVVAHRLSTLRSMDRIVVMDKGQVIEDGPYAQLVANGGVFTEMLTSELKAAA